MSHFSSRHDPEGRKELRAVYEDITACGFATEQGPINFFSGMALRPDILKAAWGLTRVMLVEGRLSARLKQLVTLAVSAQNETSYCCTTHTKALLALGVSQDIIDSCIRDVDAAHVPSPEREAIRFAKKVSAAPKTVNMLDLHTLRELGFEDEDILELVMLAAFANWTNTWADAADILSD